MVSNPDDAELLRRYVREGAQDAFAELVLRYLALVYHTALRQMNGEAHLAEDAAQKVFTLLARKSRALMRHRSLAGWLHTSTRFVASEALRSERRRRAREHEAFLMHEQLADNTANADFERMRPVLDAAIGGLSERDREAVLLRFFAGLPLASVGAKLDVSENAARMRIDRALDRLRAALVRRGVTSTSAAIGLALTKHASAATPVGLAGTITTTALSSAATTASMGMFASVLNFMSTAKLTGTFIAAALLVIGLGTMVVENSARRRDEAALARATREFAAGAAGLREQQQHLAAAEQAAADLKQQLDAARTADAAAISARAQAEAEAARTATDDPIEAGNAFMTRHPEAKQALNAYALARLNFTYGELFRALNLTPAQIEQFAAMQHFGMGASAVDGKALSLVSGDLTQEGNYSARLRSVFGEEGTAKYLEFSRTAEARDLAVKVAGALYFTETPLTPEQSDELVRFMSEARVREKGWQPQKYDWDAVLAKSTAVLSPPQLAVVAGLRARDRFLQALNEPLPPGGAPPK